jgi:photosystem II stability/assembly factor-like uncharacterized protein
MYKLVATLILFVFTLKLQAQQILPTIKILDSGTTTSIRGLCPVNDKVLWVCGSKGKVGKSINGGSSWDWMTVKGFEDKDFRDIEAFDGAEAIIMSVGEPAYILKTFDGGKNWKVVFEDKTPGIFLDAMAFWNEQSGIIVGDPIKNKIVILRTFDGGNTWRGLPDKNYPIADSAEALFASSGSNIGLMGSDAACFVTGGLKSRFYYKNKIVTLPIIQGKESTGANSVSVLFKKKKIDKIIVVGGDFNNPKDSTNNCVISTDQGKTWQKPLDPPKGYRSCVENINKTNWVACGLTGVDMSMDGGQRWQNISAIGFHVCRKAKKGNSLFFAGGNGRIGQLILP